MLAVLVDAENVSACHYPAIRARAETFGAIAVFRAFGDFSNGRCGAWLDVAAIQPVEPVLQLNGGKNASDIAIAVAAMDLLHERNLSSLCLVTSDRDFRPLVTRLRQSGLAVHGIGNGGAALRAACTSYHELAATALRPVEPAPPPAPKPEIKPEIRPAIAGPAKPAALPAPKPALDAAQRKALQAVLAKLSIDGSVSLNEFSATLHREHKALASTIGGSGLKKRLAGLGFAEFSLVGKIPHVRLRKP